MLNKRLSMTETSEFIKTFLHETQSILRNINQLHINVNSITLPKDYSIH